MLTCQSLLGGPLPIARVCTHEQVSDACGSNLRRSTSPKVPPPHPATKQASDACVDPDSAPELKREAPTGSSLTAAPLTACSPSCSGANGPPRANALPGAGDPSVRTVCYPRGECVGRRERRLRVRRSGIAVHQPMS